MSLVLRGSATGLHVMAFVFEGDLDLGAVKLNLAVADSHVLRHYLRYAQLAQMFSGLLNHVLGSAFPAFGASADEFDNVVNALGMDNLVTTLGHDRISSSSSTNTLPPSNDPTPKMTFCPAETAPLNRKRVPLSARRCSTPPALNSSN